MGWTHIPHMDTTASSGDDNPFAGPKAQPFTVFCLNKLLTYFWISYKIV